MKAQDQELVKLAYFILPGKGKRIYRLALARRIVDTTAGRDPVRRRTRVLRRAMRPSRRLHIGLGPWLRAMPACLPAPILTAALSRLDPRVRVAYVLLYVARMPRYAVRDQLVRLRVRDPWAAIEDAEAARESGSLPGPPDIAPFNPEALGPVRTRPVLPVAAAAALTVVLGGTLVVSENDRRRSTDEAGDARLVTADPDAWKEPRRSLDAWPARGDLAGDRAFTGRALRAWIREVADGPAGLAGDPQLLFAGHVGGEPVALLRRADRLARFTGRDGQIAVSSAGTDPDRPVAAGGGRYLLAPWQRAEDRTGAKVAVSGGLTEPVRARTHCRRGPVLHVIGDGRARTVGEFGGPRLVPLTHRSGGRASEPAPSAPPEAVTAARRVAAPAAPAAGTSRDRGGRLDEAGLGVWERVACSASRPARPVTEATAWSFWTGRLPGGGGSAQWVCTSMAFAGGGNAAQAAFLDAGGALDTGWCDTRRPVSGTWWRSPRGRWYYLAAAARGLTPHADGPFRTVRVRARLLTATVPAGERPAEPVTLTARPA